MKLLALGDPHLRDEKQDRDLPDTWSEYDVILCVGDVLDTSSQNLAPGRWFYRRLNALGPPVFTVPGNHDYQIHTELISNYSNIINLNQESRQFNGWCFIGLGSDRFDDGPEIRYPNFPSLKNISSGETIESVLHRIYMREIELGEVVDDDQRRKAFEEQYIYYERKYNKLVELNNSFNGYNIILLTHLPPFNSGLDKIQKNSPRWGGYHWGSIAVKNFLLRYPAQLLVSGHIHEGQGEETIAGTTCWNLGLKSAFSIDLQTNSICVEETDIFLQ